MSENKGAAESLFERVKAKLETGANLPHHTCGICGFMCHYFVYERVLHFDGSCDCAPGGWPRPVPWSEVEDKCSPNHPGWTAQFTAWLEGKEPANAGT